MVKSKHKAGIHQYIKNKLTKWWVKLWVLAYSANGYTCDFHVYIGKKAGHEPSDNGLGYGVVVKRITPLMNQSYHLYFFPTLHFFETFWISILISCSSYRDCCLEQERFRGVYVKSKAIAAQVGSRKYEIGAWWSLRCSAVERQQTCNNTYHNWKSKQLCSGVKETEGDQLLGKCTCQAA